MDLSAHLTNTALQTERGEAGVRLLDELVGCHVLSGPVQLSQRQRPPHAMGRMLDPEARHAAQPRSTQYPIFSKEDVEDLKGQVCSLLSELFKAAVEMSVHFQVRTARMLAERSYTDMTPATSERIRTIWRRLCCHSHQLS